MEKEDKIEVLREAIDNENNLLKKYCLRYMVENYDNEEDLKVFISDLFNSGCVSGMVSELVYYKDTNAFYDKYENEIEDLISDGMSNFVIESRPLFIESLNGSAENLRQEKNLLSWFAFEETIRSLNDEFKINEDFL